MSEHIHFSVPRYKSKSCKKCSICHWCVNAFPHSGKKGSTYTMTLSLNEWQNCLKLHGWVWLGTWNLKDHWKLRNRCLSGFRRAPNRANGFLTSPRYMWQILTVFCVQWDQLGNVINGRTRPGDTQKGLGWQLGTLPRNGDFLRREYTE